MDANCLPGCNRADDHDGRDAGACKVNGIVLTPGPLDLVHRHPDIPVYTPVRSEVAEAIAGTIREVLSVPATGILAYDLEPPSRPPPAAEFSPLRDALRNPRPPRPVYLPPPLPDGLARVKLDDDYDYGASWSDWKDGDTDHPADVWDIPAEQRDRWVKAEADYHAMQSEIEALREVRMREPGYPNVPPGWKRKGAPYQVQP